MARKPPRWYFNFRSPYSWLAQLDLERHHPEVADAVEWIPYWDPDELSLRLLAEAGGAFVYTPMTKEKHRYLLVDVRRLAADRGLAVSWPVDEQPRWETAHLGYLLADRAGVGRAYVELVYRARFQEGRNISDPAVIGDIAAALGLDAAAVAGSAENGELRAEGVELLLAAYKDGVFGPPFFIAGREKYWGVDRLARFAEAVRAGLPQAGPVSEAVPAVEPDERLLTVPAGPAGDPGHAGGCG